MSSCSWQHYVEQLKTTHLLLAHGIKDTIVPSVHSEILEAAYSGTGNVRRLAAPDAGHNLAFYGVKDELRRVLEQWL